MVLKEDLWRYFASDYVIARQRFLDASAMAEAILTTLTISEKWAF